MGKKKARPERGAASMLVELEDSRIRVLHGTDGTVLAEGVVQEGAWDALWDMLTALGVKKLYEG